MEDTPADVAGAKKKVGKAKTADDQAKQMIATLKGIQAQVEFMGQLRDERYMPIPLQRARERARKQRRAMEQAKAKQQERT